jgi:heme-degrading monooxygenase HmoA
MIYVLVHITFEDFEKWKAGFDAGTALRKAYGSKGVRAFRSVDRPNEVTILGEYEDMQKARQMFQSQEFRDAVRQAGVTGQPTVSFVEQVLDMPA